MIAEIILFSAGAIAGAAGLDLITSMRNRKAEIARREQEKILKVYLQSLEDKIDTLVHTSGAQSVTDVEKALLRGYRVQYIAMSDEEKRKTHA